jgi:hypothetical protein
MTTGPAQHVGDNAFHPFRFNALTLQQYIRLPTKDRK